jgi:hypothetical protein
MTTYRLLIAIEHALPNLFLADYKEGRVKKDVVDFTYKSAK